MITTQIDDITTYMADIRSFGRISVSEETELATLIKSDDKETKQKALDKLICTNLKLVVKIAHDFKGYSVSFADLVAEGNLGLITAAQRFDPSKGAKFSCYAAWWIKQAIRRAVANQAHTIRTPSSTQAQLRTIYKITAKWETQHGSKPSAEELSKQTGISVNVIESLARLDTDTIPLSGNPDDESSVDFECVLSQSEDEIREKSERKSKLWEALDNVSDLDRYIVSRVYGIYHKKAELPDIAQEVGVTSRDLERRLPKIMQKLRVMLQD